MNFKATLPCCCLVVFIFFFFNGFSQKSKTFPPTTNPIEIKATRTTQKIKIDGVLNENDWKNAQRITDFFRTEPQQGGKYLYKTEVKILFDSKNLYIGAFCKDSLGKKGIRVQDLRRDFQYGENDIFAVQIDAQNTKQYTVSFQTTPYGNQRDLQVFNGDNVDNNWNALWSVKTTRTDDGYYAEFAIPFKTLRYDKPKANELQEWGITFFRLARRDYEQTVFPKIPQAFSPFRMSYAAKLTGIEVPPPSTNLQITPYVLYNYDQQKEGNTLINKNSKPKIGGDVKWAINPNSVIDLTINTDFAQADADKAVNNLERFNVFFPEKRQFFLENSGIWAGADNFQIKPFFSRSIGLKGNFNAQPAPIDIGARFTNKSDKKTIGGLYVKQRATNDSPDTHFGVARYTQNYGKENNIGVMVTHRFDTESKKLALNNQHNSTITIDGLIRPTSSFYIGYMASTSIDKNDNGYAGRLKIGHYTNKHYLGFISNFVSNKYNPAMGYVFQKNVVYYSPAAYHFWRPKSNFIRKWDFGGFASLYHDFKDFGRFQQASIKIEPIYTWFKNNDFFRVAIIPTWQNINFTFKPLGIEILKKNYSYTMFETEYKSDASKKLSGNLKYRFGNFYNGKRQSINGGIRFAPLPNISISGEYEYNDLKELGINSQNLYTNLYTAGVRLALNPRVQLSGFYQYNDFTKTGRVNARFSWEYLPQSFVYLVFNNTESDAFNPMKTQQQFISKITFVKQF